VRSPGTSGGLPTNLPGTAVSPTQLVRPPREDVVPPGRVLTAARAGAIAERIAKVRRERREYRGSTREVFLKGTDRWQVSFFAKTKPRQPRKEIGQVLIDDATGRVIEAWTEYQVPWSMARGYPGAFGRIVNAPWVWIPLAVLFVAPFLRPPWRMLHLDLLVLSAFSVSTAFFNAARVDWSVPLVYPLLGYLLARMLWIGLRRGETEHEQSQRPLRLLVLRLATAQADPQHPRQQVAQQRVDERHRPVHARGVEEGRRDREGAQDEQVEVQHPPRRA